jgi:hypothetical protein
VARGSACGPAAPALVCAGDLVSFDASKRIAIRRETSMVRLAQAIGAGADLLAGQDPGTVAALDDRENVAAARAEVAAVVVIAVADAEIVLCASFVVAGSTARFLLDRIPDEPELDDRRQAGRRRTSRTPRH